jgi:AraC-like DNA-binding protein
MTDISVEEIANRLNLDRTYFSVIFKKKVGISPKQYLLKYRMNIATTLLADNLSVSVVARSVGYSDLYIFSKMFKRHFGVSPTEYLKQQQ